MSNDLKACLDGYLEAGRVESSGDFTISETHAQEKLREFRLHEPRLYVLNLVASAVAGGARAISFENDADELWWESDQRLSDLGKLEQLGSLVLSSSSVPSLRELAIGLHGVLPLKPEVLDLEAGDGERTARLLWSGSEFEFDWTGNAEHEPFVKLHVKERLGLRVIRKFAAKTAGGMVGDSEEDAVFRYCNRSAVPISFNGKKVNRPFILGKTQHFAFGPRDLPQSHPLKTIRNFRSGTGPLHGLLARHGRLAPWVTLVVNGVNFRLPENAFTDLLAGIRGVVYADHLKKDLSQVGLVQDQEFENVLAEIRALANRRFFGIEH